MMTVTNMGTREFVPIQVDRGLAKGDDPIWFDLLEPTLDEVQRLESLLKLELPTRVDMEEIESSSRLYLENESVFLTATMMTNAESDHAEITPVSFILSGRCMITIRYVDNVPFRNFVRMSHKRTHGYSSAPEALSFLLDAVIDRLADILERIGTDLDQLSKRVFRKQVPKYGKERRTFDDHLRDVVVQLGRDGDINSKARDSLVSMNRLLVFLSNVERNLPETHSMPNLLALNSDIASLSDHANFINSKISFLLDATLGLISIEQNQVIKIFTIFSVIFMPPTLVAGIYGMNFDFMPELRHSWGYPYALFLMILSSTLPLVYFFRRGWI